MILHELSFSMHFYETIHTFVTAIFNFKQGQLCDKWQGKLKGTLWLIGVWTYHHILHIKNMTFLYI